MITLYISFFDDASKDLTSGMPSIPDHFQNDTDKKVFDAQTMCRWTTHMVQNPLHNKAPPFSIFPEKSFFASLNACI